MDYLIPSMDSLVEEQIFIMKQSQVTKWDSLQGLLNLWYILILENIKNNTKKDFHQKKKLVKDGKNMKNNKKKKLKHKKMIQNKWNLSKNHSNKNNFQCLILSLLQSLKMIQNLKR